MNALNIICSICLSELASSDMPQEVLGCGHVFHKDCISPWLDVTFNQCPICKQTCSLDDKKPIYLSSQPALEPTIVDSLHFGFNMALQQSQEELEKSLEKRIAVFQRALLDQMEKIQSTFDEKRCQNKKAKEDWLESYSRLETVIVVLAAYIVFESAMTDNFMSWFLFFILIEEAILSKDREIQKQKQKISQLESQ